MQNRWRDAEQYGRLSSWCSHQSHLWQAASPPPPPGTSKLQSSARWTENWKLLHHQYCLGRPHWPMLPWLAELRHRGTSHKGLGRQPSLAGRLFSCLICVLCVCGTVWAEEVSCLLGKPTQLTCCWHYSLLSANGHQSPLSHKKQQTQPSYHLVTTSHSECQIMCCVRPGVLANPIQAQDSRFFVRCVMSSCGGSAMVQCWWVPPWWIHLPKLQNLLSQIAKCIFPNCKMYLSKFKSIYTLSSIKEQFSVDPEEAWDSWLKYISTNFWIIYLNSKMYLSKLQDVVVQIAKCICPNFQMYLSKF